MSIMIIDYLPVIAIAIGLSADCFAVAVCSSISKTDHSRSDILRVASSFGGFQTVMPIIGWAAGRTVVDFIASYDHWVAFALLAFVGGRMVRESFHQEHGAGSRPDNTRGVSLLLVSLATSIDALAVGLTFAFLEINVIAASIIIGLVAFLVTGTGFVVGRKTGEVIGKRAELIGGIILIAIGLRVLLSHLLGTGE